MVASKVSQFKNKNGKTIVITFADVGLKNPTIKERSAATAKIRQLRKDAANGDDAAKEAIAGYVDNSLNRQKGKSSSGSKGYQSELKQIESGKPIELGTFSKISPATDEKIGTSYRVRKLKPGESSEYWRQGFQLSGDYVFEEKYWKGSPSNGKWEVKSAYRTPLEAAASNKGTDYRSINSSSSLFKMAQNKQALEQRKSAITRQTESFFKSRAEAKQEITRATQYLNRLNSLDLKSMDAKQKRQHSAELKKTKDRISSAQSALKTKAPSATKSILTANKRKKQRLSTPN